MNPRLTDSAVFKESFRDDRWDMTESKPYPCLAGFV
jgi:hypothetical protein